MKTPRRLSNQKYRDREHLNTKEIAKLINCAGKGSRYPVRDKALLLIMFRHGLRVSEAVGLRWDSVSLEDERIAIKRLKGSDSGIHKLQPDEIELLTQLEQRSDSPYVFLTERNTQLSTDSVDRILKRAAKAAGLTIKVHPHMIRHSTGYYLAEKQLPTRDIQAYLGHRNIANTVRYTASNPARFDNIVWDI
jgi:integrase